jgi:hypothetical protein
LRSVYEEQVSAAAEIQRTFVQGTARLCNPAFGRVCKALWPLKTAEELASRAGCAVRTAAYEIAGERDPSARSILVVLTEITPRRK